MIYDLIYAGEHRKELEGIVENAYPQAKLEDASDYIHEGRFSVQLEDIEQDDWLLFVMVEGILDISLISQMERMGNPDHYLTLLRQAVEIKRKQKGDQNDAETGLSGDI